MANTIRIFNTNDIPYALTQIAREGWDATGEFFNIWLSHEPTGCFIAENDGKPIGMIVTTRFGQSAWISNVIVSPEKRRQGIGELLMRTAMTYLTDHEVKTIRLEADPPGVALYQKLGFRDEFESLRFRAVAKACQTIACDLPLVEQLTKRDIPTVNAFDFKNAHEDRGSLLDKMLKIAHHGYQTTEEDRLTGYAMIMPSTAGVRLGPWQACSRSSAKALLMQVLVDFAGQTILVGVPDLNSNAVELLESSGFVRTPSCRRMVFGDSSQTCNASNIYAVANGATG